MTRGSPPRRLRFHAWWLLLSLAVLAGACAPPGGAARGPLPAFQQYQDREVQAVRFAGNLQLPVDSLRAVVVTRGPRCWLVVLPVCLPFTSLGRTAYKLDLPELQRDVARLQLYYRDHGYYGTRIVPSVDPVGDEQVIVRFAVAPGDQVILRQLDVEGTEGIVPPDELTRQLPLGVGQPFRRIGFLNSADTVRLALLRRGYAYAEVLRNYSLDTIADVAEAQFLAIPGPLVHVDSILFAGANRLSASTLRQQITFREGDLLKLPELARSQRNLYDLAMVSFASLQLAPDSLQLDPDSSSATVLARVVEAPQYLVDAGVGLGTVDCVRSDARLLDRNFLGGGRSLQLEGSVSRLGVAYPLAAGLDKNICNVGRDVLFADTLNYRVAATFQQPQLFSTRNQLTLGLHDERIAQLGVYLRRSTGGQLTLSRQVTPRLLTTAGFTLRYGRTLAQPAAYCVTLDVCTPEVLQQLSANHWTNAFALSAAYDRTRSTGGLAGASRGWSARAGVDWSPALVDTTSYLRLVGSLAYYRPLHPGYLLAATVRGGTFVQGSVGPRGGFIPPELRFYGGGPNSVRGFGLNRLGPTVYVTDSLTVIDSNVRALPVGGTRTLISTLELRGPSPWYTDYFRWAAFVDAGQVWAPGSRVSPSNIYYTPGVGLRIITPVGPVRVDVAYNRYPAEAGSLYYLDPATKELLLFRQSYRPAPHLTFWDRLQFSFAVGQAF